MMILYLLAGVSSFRDPSKSALASVDAMQAFLAFLIYGIGAALCIAVATAGVAHLLKPFITALNRRLAIALWVRSRIRKLQPPEKRPDFKQPRIPEWLLEALPREYAELGWDIEQRFATVRKILLTRIFRSQIKYMPFAGIPLTGSIRDELFMHAAQSAARGAISHPLGSPWLFALLTANVSARASGAAVAFDFIASRNPQLAARLSAIDSGPPAPTAAAIDDSQPSGTGIGLSAAESTISDAADRALDELQLRLMAGGVWVDRAIAILIGAWLAWIVTALMGVGGGNAFLAVGILGGMLSTLVSDLLATVMKDRR